VTGVQTCALPIFIIHTGAVGASGVMTIAPAPLGFLDPHDIIGVATEDLALNAFGFVSVTGDLRGFDTTGTPYGEVWNDGDELWYNPAFVGGLTNVIPVAPNQKTHIGVVINAGGGGSGSIDIHISRGSSLGASLQGVEITAVADLDVLQYDSALGYWANVAASTLVAGSVTNALTNGTYITSTGTYDGSVARTFAVDATTTNTASKVVARDGSGDFAAGRITAAGLTSTETIIPHTTKGIVGTTTNDNAQAGSVGEETTPTNLTAVALTTSTSANVSSVSLSAGDYDIGGVCRFLQAGGATATSLAVGVSTVSTVFGALGTYGQVEAPFPANANNSILAPWQRISLSATTTVYLVVWAFFTGATIARKSGV